MPGLSSDLDVLPWYREPWPWILMGIPFATVVAGIATLIIAINSPNAMVEDDYYKAGLAINQEKQRLRTARTLGLAGWLRSDGTGVMLTLTGPSSQQPHTLQLRAIHATRAELDRTLTLDKVDADSYRAPALQLSPGNWYFRLGPESEQWELRAQNRVEGRFQMRLTGDE